MPYEYDAEKAIFSHCRFCHGRGCLACPGEAEKYKHLIAQQQELTASKALSLLCELEPMRSIIEEHERYMESLPPEKRNRPRFEDGVYRDCPLCDGAGCEKCPEEADKEYNRQFPDGPKPILIIDRRDPVDSILKHFPGVLIGLTKPM